MRTEPLRVTVSALNRKIAFMLASERTFEDICVEGEISNYTLHTKTGHIFFTLKDDSASMKAVMFRSNAQRLRIKPENGMRVVVRGSVKCFERDGIYQLYAADITENGEGELSAAFEELKARLEAEGLFSRKRPLPYPPEKVCVITSETGAALQDILNILGRRCPLVKVTLIPASVQGETAPASIVSAFEKANKTDCDVIIFGRGGGSAEDLSAFNHEAVARAVYNSRIPTISAVGHETDFSLSDFTADKRAPTPSAAAEMCVPVIAERLEMLEEVLKGIRSKVLDSISEKSARLHVSEITIKSKSPLQRLESEAERIDSVSSGIKAKLHRLLDSCESRLMNRAAVIEALNPMSVLTRGYSITYKDGKALMDASQADEGDRLEIKLANGSINAVVTGSQKCED